jgi:hypothetical protein
MSQSRVSSDAPGEALCQPEAIAEQHPKHWNQHDKDDCHAHQTYQQGFMVEGMPVAHGAEYDGMRI